MALNVEIWMHDIVENFWPSNSFAVRSVDHSQYVNGKTVHIPNGGAAAPVTKNRTTYPAPPTERADVDMTYDIDKYDIAPLLVHQLELVELSYDKRQSLLYQSKTELQRVVLENVMKTWLPSGVASVATSGDGEAAHVASATGQRKSLTRGDVLSVKKRFDLDDVPAEGRCMLLDAVMYNQLLNSLTNAESVNFVAGADAVSGVVGKFLGFDFYMRSSVLTAAAGGTLKSGAAAATDSAAGLAWQQNCVCRAMGAVEAFESDKDPTYYGDIFSFAMRAGGHWLRADKKGVVLIYQGSVS